MKKLLNKCEINSKGITLIALVITIIILLILAGVTISNLTENGLFAKAQQSKERTEYVSAKEIVTMKLTESIINEQASCTIKDVASNIKDANNITIEKYYNKEMALIKNGVTENLINLEAIVVSTNKYPKYKFLIGEKCKITGILTEEITDTTEIGEFKDIQTFENEMIEKNNITADLLVSYKIKDNNENINRRQYTELVDLTGNENSTNLYDIDTTEEAEGIIFDGLSSYVRLNIQQELTFPLTIEITVKLNEQKRQVIYLDPNTNIAIGIIGNGNFCVSIEQYTNTFLPPSDLYNGGIKNITVTYNSLEDNQVYINGEKLEKSSSTNAWTSGIGTNTYLGRREQGDYFDGILYTFRIYNKVLTESEIISSYYSDKNFIENTENKINRSDLLIEYVVKDNNENKYYEIPNIIKDMTQNENDAVCYNGKYNTNNDGIVFDGSSSYVQLNLEKKLTFPLTIEMTIKLDEKKRQIIYLDPNINIAIGTMSDGDFCVSTGQYTNTFSAPSDFYNGEIKNIIVTYNSLEDNQIYVNSKKLEKNESTNAWTSGIGINTYLGKREDGDYFKGTLYEFYIYEKILNQDEINKQYEYIKLNY